MSSEERGDERPETTVEHMGECQKGPVTHGDQKCVTALKREEAVTYSNYGMNITLYGWAKVRGLRVPYGGKLHVRFLPGCAGPGGHARGRGVAFVPVSTHAHAHARTPAHTRRNRQVRTS